MKRQLSCFLLVLMVGNKLNYREICMSTSKRDENWYVSLARTLVIEWYGQHILYQAGTFSILALILLIVSPATTPPSSDLL